MNFLDAQERAERVRRRMRLTIGLAMAWVPVVGLGMAFWRRLSLETMSPLDLAGLWNLALEPLLISSLWLGGMVLVSVFRLWQIRSLGGAGLALEMGAREITVPTRTAQERQLLNVVDEMGVAASMVPPRVFLLDGQDEPNALSLGQELEDGVLIVTKGLLETLERDELQAVVAHEIAHLRQGDAALNTWLMGIFNGVAVFSAPVRFVLGAILKQRFTVPRRTWDTDHRMFGLMLLLVACFLVWLRAPVLSSMLMASVLSWAVVYMARARITQDMEHRADAVAVQLTRYPRSLGTALARLSVLLKPESNSMEGFGHMLFVRVHANSRWAALTASHPGWEERVRRVAPEVLNEVRRPAEVISPVSPAARPSRESQTSSFASVDLPMLPPALRRSLERFDGARSALLAVMQRELGAQTSALPPNDPMWSFCRVGGDAVHLPLFDMSLPVLRAGGREERAALVADVDRLIRSTPTPPLVAHAFRSILFRALEEHAAVAPAPGVLVPRRVKEHVALVLAQAARMQGSSPAEQSAAFDAAVALAPGRGPWLMGPPDPSLEEMALALRHLAAGGAAFRRKLIDAVRCAMHHDGRWTLREEVWLRAVAQALRC